MAQHAKNQERSKAMEWGWLGHREKAGSRREYPAQDLEEPARTVTLLSTFFNAQMCMVYNGATVCKNKTVKQMGVCTIK